MGLIDFLFGKKSKKKSKKAVKFMGIKKLRNSKKKFEATFEINGRTKKVKFGANGYSDFTKHKDLQRKQRYIKRHKKHENWANLMSPGALSLYILWNKPTLSASISDYKRRFNKKYKNTKNR